jgi:hypothetical protein
MTELTGATSAQVKVTVEPLPASSGRDAGSERTEAYAHVVGGPSRWRPTNTRAHHEV